MRPTATFHLSTIATECTDSSRAEPEIKTTINQLLRRNKSIQRRNFLEKIMRKGLGTNKTEAAAKSLALDCSTKGNKTMEQIRKSFIHSIMQIKLENANEAVKVEDFKFHQQKKRVEKVINNSNILERVTYFLNKEAEIEWSKTRDKLSKKLKHLGENWTG